MQQTYLGPAWCRSGSVGNSGTGAEELHQTRVGGEALLGAE
jgi:hypothetical protein